MLLKLDFEWKYKPKMNTNQGTFFNFHGGGPLVIITNTFLIVTNFIILEVLSARFVRPGAPQLNILFFLNITFNIIITKL